MKAELKLIKDISFPKSGDYFATHHIPQEVDEPNLGFGVGVTTRTITDNSYSEDIFLCLESDATRVIGRKVHGLMFDDKPIILLRERWRMDNVDHLLPSLGIFKEGKDGSNSFKKNT